MCGIITGIITSVVGAVLVAVSCYMSFGFIPDFVENLIIDELVLKNDTIQMERFEEVPTPLLFQVRMFNISNPAAVLAGAVPSVNEVGPFVYKQYQRRVVENFDDDMLTYRIINTFIFDKEASEPYTEDDIVTIVNVPYHAILQVAESQFPDLIGILSTVLNAVFAEYNTPIVTVRVRDMLFDGIPFCQNPGLIGSIACNQIRQIASTSKNIEELPGGALSFSLLKYRNDTPSSEYKASRGLNDAGDLGGINSFDEAPFLSYWMNDEDENPSACNMLNGTDSGIYSPFVDTEKSLFAFNSDICRSVELRYQYDLEYVGIPAVRFSSNEWFLDNHQGCFCLNLTSGITAENGCLLQGAQELYSCVGAFLILTYPHFLYADLTYRNGVIGITPDEESHRIFIDLEPKTGTVVRGSKRAQFNMFLRPIRSISATGNLPNRLTPIVWIDEGVALGEEFTDELKTKLLERLNLVDIIIPVVISMSAAICLAGVIVLVCAVMRNSTQKNVLTKPSTSPVTRN